MPLGPGVPIDGNDLTFASEQGCAYYKGQRIQLSELTLDVLRCIHAGHPTLVSNESLRIEVWHTLDRDPNLPQQQITKLNRILPKFGFHIRNVPNLGYALALIDDGNAPDRSLEGEQSPKYNAPRPTRRLNEGYESAIGIRKREEQAPSSLDANSSVNGLTQGAPIRAGIDELIAAAGLSAFYPSRDYYAKYREVGNIDQYVSTATRSVLMVSINLMTGIPIAGVCEALITKLKANSEFTALISLLNPELPHLMASLAPVLSTTPAGLAHSIRESLNRLSHAKSQLRANERTRFSIRVHDTIPMGSAILLDHRESFGRIQIESKVYKAPPRMSFAFEVVRTGRAGFYETLA